MSTAIRKVWEVTIQHQELHKTRHIRGTHPHLVEQKAALQLAIWNDAWKKRQWAERRRQEQELSVRSKTESLALADSKNEDARCALQKLANLLPRSVASASDRDLDSFWPRLLDQREFTLPRPAEPKSHPLPDAPQPDDIRYQPSLSFLDRRVRKLREQKELEAQQLYQQDHNNWLQNKRHIEQQNLELAAGYADRLNAWEERRLTFASQLEANNQLIAEQYSRYLAQEPDAICDHCDLVLTQAPHPYESPGEWTLDYRAQHKMLILDYTLPPANELPKLKAVNYVAESNSFNQTFLSSSEQQELYAQLFFQLPLLLLHELFRGDGNQALDSIVFNGWTTNTPSVCVLSVKADKAHLLSLDLQTQNAETLLKQLTSQFSTPPHAAHPITPLAQIDKSHWRISPIGIK